MLCLNVICLETMLDDTYDESVKTKTTDTVIDTLYELCKASIDVKRFHIIIT